MRGATRHDGERFLMFPDMRWRRTTEVLARIYTQTCGQTFPAAAGGIKQMYIGTKADARLDAIKRRPVEQSLGFFVGMPAFRERIKSDFIKQSGCLFCVCVFCVACATKASKMGWRVFG